MVYVINKMSALVIKEGVLQHTASHSSKDFNLKVSLKIQQCSTLSVSFPRPFFLGWCLSIRDYMCPLQSISAPGDKDLESETYSYWLPIFILLQPISYV